jgi:hypothetical protein
MRKHASGGADRVECVGRALTDRLNRLVDEGVLERVPYSERPERFEYRLTNKGRELGVALLALMQWGDRHLSNKPPRIARRRSDNSPVSVRLVAKDAPPSHPATSSSCPDREPNRPRRSPKATAR